MQRFIEFNELERPFLAAAICLALVLLGLFLRGAYRAYVHPLRNVPGPWQARFTRLWLLRAITSRHYHTINAQLHRKYGPVVRIAPNEYSIDDPEAAKIIYRSRDQLLKAPRYSAWGMPTEEPNLLTFLDIEHHAQRRRQVASLYQPTALANIEYQVDATTTSFLAKLAVLARHRTVIDAAEWLQFYTFDTIGAVTFGKPFGFLEKGTDVADLMTTSHSFARYGAVLSTFYEWHPTVFRLLQLIAPKGEVGIGYIYAFAGRCVAEWNKRTEKEKTLDDEKTEGGENLTSDFLGSLLSKARRSPGNFSIDDAYYHVISPVLAGGETPGIALTAATYCFCKYPRVLEKLREEVISLRGRSPNKMITLKEAHECSYLQGVIKEVLRLFPIIGLNLPRVVPKGGLILAGQQFPEGTIVGINAWVAHTNRSVFGPDADEFRPERWLVSAESAHKMEQYMFTFGKGPRACLGKTLALMEINKLIPELVLRFDIDFADPGKDWTLQSDLFVKQSDFHVRVSERKVDA